MRKGCVSSWPGEPVPRDTEDTRSLVQNDGPAHAQEPGPGPATVNANMLKALNHFTASRLRHGAAATVQEMERQLQAQVEEFVHRQRSGLERRAEASHSLAALYRARPPETPEAQPAHAAGPLVVAASADEWTPHGAAFEDQYGGDDDSNLGD